MIDNINDNSNYEDDINTYRIDNIYIYIYIHTYIHTYTYIFIRIQYVYSQYSIINVLSIDSIVIIYNTISKYITVNSMLLTVKFISNHL